MGEGKHFCVGADLKDEERWKIGQDGDLLMKSRLTQIGRDLIESIIGINQITIAAMQGAAAGGGESKDRDGLGSAEIVNMHMLERTWCAVLLVA